MVIDGDAVYIALNCFAPAVGNVEFRIVDVDLGQHFLLLLRRQTAEPQGKLSVGNRDGVGHKVRLGLAVHLGQLGGLDVHVIVLHVLRRNADAVFGGLGHVAGGVAVHVGTEDDHIIGAVGKVYIEAPVGIPEPRRGHGIIVQTVDGAAVAAFGRAHGILQPIPEGRGVDGSFVDHGPVFFLSAAAWPEIVPGDGGCVVRRCKGGQREGRQDHQHRENQREDLLRFHTVYNSLFSILYPYSRIYPYYTGSFLIFNTIWEKV